MAASRSIGGIYAELSLKDAQFRRGLKNAGEKLKGFAVFGAKAGAVATGALAAGLAVGTKKTIGLGAELDHLSTQTGVSVAALMTLQQAYKDAGKSADSAGKDVGKMQRAIYDAAQDPGGSMDYFAELGMSAEKLMQMSPEEQFFAIGKALKDTENKTKQAALALSIFGRSGGELLTVFEGTTLSDVNESLGKMPEIMEQFSGAMERADTLMGRLPNKADQFFAGFTSGVIGQLLPGLEQVNGKDFTELGESLGDSVSEGLQLITDGTIWEVFRLQGEKALLSLQNSDAMSGFASGVNASFDYLFAGEDFDSAFDKYAEAGIQANAELAADLDKRIAALLTENRERSQKKKSDAAAIGAPTTPFGDAMSLIPDWMKPDDFYRTPPALDDEKQEREEKRDWQSTSYRVNEMQARGLGMGATFIKDEGKKQTTLLTEMRDILRGAETDGTLRWA